MICIHPDAISWLVEAMEGHDDRLCVMGYRLFSSRPGDLDFTAVALPVELKCPIQSFIQQNFGPPHCFLSARNAVIRAGGFQSSAGGAEDWDLCGPTSCWRNTPDSGGSSCRSPISPASRRGCSTILVRSCRRDVKYFSGCITRSVRAWRCWQLTAARTSSAERRVLRRLRLQGVAPDLLVKLGTAIHELYCQGFRQQTSRPRLLERVIGFSAAEAISLALLRRTRPSVIRKYCEGFA